MNQRVVELQCTRMQRSVDECIRNCTRGTFIVVVTPSSYLSSSHIRCYHSLTLACWTLRVPQPWRRSWSPRNPKQPGWEAASAAAGSYCRRRPGRPWWTGEKRTWDVTETDSRFQQKQKSNSKLLLQHPEAQTHLYELEDSERGGAVVSEHEANDAQELSVEAAVAKPEQKAAEQRHRHAEIIR